MISEIGMPYLPDEDGMCHIVYSLINPAIETDNSFFKLGRTCCIWSNPWISRKAILQLLQVRENSCNCSPPNWWNNNCHSL